jgi:hypothetical protein
MKILLCLLCTACGGSAHEYAQALLADAEVSQSCALPITVHSSPQWVDQDGVTVSGEMYWDRIELGSTYLDAAHELIHCHEWPDMNTAHTGWGERGYWGLDNFYAWTIGLDSLNGGKFVADPTALGPLEVPLRLHGWGQQINEWRAAKCAEGWQLPTCP